MALIFCDGFDSYGVAGDFTRKWNAIAGNAPTLSTSGGRYGGGAMVCNSYYTSCGLQTGQYANFAIANQLYFGFHMKTTGGPNADGSASYGNCGLCLPNSNNGAVTVVTVGTAIPGAVQLLKLGSTTVLGTGTINVCDNNWHWIEVAVLLSSTGTGWGKVYVDGVLQINYSGATMAGAYTLNGSAQLTYMQNTNGNNATWTFDDFVAWDNTGSFMNTFPIGPRRIATLNPNGAGASTQFTPSTGSNWSCVSQAYTGTANVSDASTGHSDLYTTGGMPYTAVGTINTVVVNHYSTNPSGDGTKSVASKLRSGGTPAVATGTSRLLGNIATSYQDAFYQDATGTNWTQATATAIQPGVGD